MRNTKAGYVLRFRGSGNILSPCIYSYRAFLTRNFAIKLIKGGDKFKFG